MCSLSQGPSPVQLPPACTNSCAFLVDPSLSYTHANAHREKWRFQFSFFFFKPPETTSASSKNTPQVVACTNDLIKTVKVGPILHLTATSPFDIHSSLSNSSMHLAFFLLLLHCQERIILFCLTAYIKTSAHSPARSQRHKDTALLEIFYMSKSHTGQIYCTHLPLKLLSKWRNRTDPI